MQAAQAGRSVVPDGDYSVRSSQLTAPRTSFAAVWGRPLADRIDPMGKQSGGGSQAAAPAVTESAMPPPSSLTVAQPAQSSKTEGLETEVGRLNAENELLKKRLYDSQDEVSARGFRSRPSSALTPLGSHLRMACLLAAWKAELLGCEKNEHRLTSAPPPHFQVNRLKGMIESQDKKSFKSDSDSQSTGNSAKKSQSRLDSPPSRSAPQPASCAAQPFAMPISFSQFFVTASRARHSAFPFFCPET